MLNFPCIGVISGNTVLLTLDATDQHHESLYVNLIDRFGLKIPIWRRFTEWLRAKKGSVLTIQLWAPILCANWLPPRPKYYINLNKPTPSTTLILRGCGESTLSC